MPELPEVETVVRALKKVILNKEIKSVDVYYGKQIKGDINSLIGKRIIDIRRRGKNIIFCFEKLYMIVHLRMEGKFFIKDRTEEIGKHEHIVFHFAEFDLRYDDVRKFGEITIKDNDCLDIGVEATNITKQSLSSKKEIKEILLNQKIIAGIGNIYADEICYYARVMPNSIIGEDKYDLIIEGAKKILEASISCGGTTIRSYNSLGTKGNYQDHLVVHSMNNCRNCGYKTNRITVAGRTTYYCPNCQKDNIIIGLTGGIATGKSTISKRIEDMGYNLIDSDKIVNELWHKEEIVNKIKELFQLDAVNKQIVSKLVFSDVQKRNMLNSLIHPLVKKEIEKRIKKGPNFVDVPLLFESGFDALCDYTICVYLEDELAISRLMKRNDISYEDAKKRVEAQIPIKEKRRKSTFFIDNSKDEENSYNQLNKILKEIGLCQ